MLEGRWWWKDAQKVGGWVRWLQKLKWLRDKPVRMKCLAANTFVKSSLKSRHGLTYLFKSSHRLTNLVKSSLKSNHELTNLIKSSLKSSQKFKMLVKPSLKSSHELTSMVKSSIKSSHRLKNLVKSSLKSRHKLESGVSSLIFMSVRVLTVPNNEFHTWVWALNVSDLLIFGNRLWFSCTLILVNLL